MFLAEVIVGLGSGAFGALGAPWVTHRMSTTARLAERRAEPYAQILRAARSLRDITLSTYDNDPDSLRAWGRARDELYRVLDDADAVTSGEMRQATEKLLTAAEAAAALPRPQAGEGDAAARWATIEPLASAWTAVSHAYEELRDQAQRKTSR